MTSRNPGYALVLASIALCAIVSCSHGSQQTRAGALATRDAPEVSSAAAARGAHVFATQCAACHGSDGSGGPAGPALHHERAKTDPAAIVELIKNPSPPMPKLFPAQLSAQDVTDVAAYVESL